MAHVDVPERASLFKVPPGKTEEAGGIFGSRAAVLWGTAGIALVVLVIIAAINFASRSGVGGPAAIPGIHQQLTVGEQDEVVVRLPPRSWWDLDIDKPVVIRLSDGQRFERRPDGSIYKIEAGGALTPVTTVGDTIPGGTIYLLAKKGEKMAKVTVATVKK